tara:strand:- start:2082 stop:3161 length:1080 start_codon:yes stop_codon:yes gene_type:complete
MKAAVLYKPGFPLPVENVELQKPQPGEVMVKLSAAGVCHSDYHFVSGFFTPTRTPLVMGHEGAGIVTEVGENVKTVNVGDKVILSMDSMCGKCKNCTIGQPTMCLTYPRTFKMPDGTTRFKKNGTELYHMVGTFSEYTVLPEDQLVIIPQETPLDKACIIGCAVITGIGSVINRAKVKMGDTTAVFGCGGVGLNTIQGCSIAGASKIIAVDTVDSKLEKAIELGATHTINPTKVDAVQAINDLTSGGVNFAFDVVGDPKVIKTAFTSTRPGGTTVIVGIPPTDLELSIKGWDILLDRTIMGAFHGGARARHDFLWILDLYNTGRIKLDELITGYRPLDEINEAFDDLIQGKSIRTVLTF